MLPRGKYIQRHNVIVLHTYKLLHGKYHYNCYYIYNVIYIHTYNMLPYGKYIICYLITYI